MFKHILLPTDGSETARKAIGAGLRFAKEAGAKVTCFYGIEDMNPHHAGVHPSPQVQAEIDRRTRQIADMAVAEVVELAKKEGVAIETHVMPVASPHEGIVATAADRGCDLILMASHGRGALSSLMTGSVTLKVLATSKLPVLVYR